LTPSSNPEIKKMAPNAALEPYRSASIGIGDRLALELLLGFTGMRNPDEAILSTAVR
jgi:hypothetical protein